MDARAGSGHEKNVPTWGVYTLFSHRNMLPLHGWVAARAACESCLTKVVRNQHYLALASLGRDLALVTAVDEIG